MTLLWLIPLILLILFIIIMIAVDSNRFVTRRYEIISDKVSKNVRVVFLSDLHNKVYGKNNDVLIKAIKDQKPDIALLGGDIMTAYPGRDFSVATSFVRAIKEKFPVAYALGNHEYRARIYPEVYGSLFDDYKNEISGMGIEFLDNSFVTFFNEINVYGLTMDAVYYRRFRHYPMADDYTKGLLGERDNEKFNIVMAHDPDYFDSYANWKPDLVLSGHNHGGVVRIPGWKGVISPMWRLFPRYDGGRFKKGSSTMIVSRGLGMHTIPLRLFNPAEIVVIDIKKE